MPARNSVVTVTTEWTAISNGAVSTILLMQHRGALTLEVAFASSAPATDAEADILWPPLAMEMDLAVPNGPLTVWGRVATGSAEVKVIHA